jgi:hypothetical protein
MSQANSESWRQARRARDELADQLLDHPDVSLIDIGYDPDRKGGEATERIVLRVHVRRSLDREALGLPEEIDGIPVRVVVADYRLE